MNIKVCRPKICTAELVAGTHATRIRDGGTGRERDTDTTLRHGHWLKLLSRVLILSIHADAANSLFCGSPHHTSIMCIGGMRMHACVCQALAAKY